MQPRLTPHVALDRTTSRRPTRGLRRAALATRTVVAATVMGMAAALAVASPAAAADPVAPTISTPAQRTGFGTITITGTARPGAQVSLYESAISWNDMQPAVDWERGGGRLTVTANSAGAYQIVRYVDSGFMFAVEADGVMSPTRRVLVQVLPVFWLESTRSGTVVANVDVSPNQPELVVHIQRATADWSWTTVGTGRTDSIGGYSHTMTGERPGTIQSYRAVVDTDHTTGVITNTSAIRSVKVAGTPPASPNRAGVVQFTKIQYDSPGTDSGSNTSLNNEWFRVTNKTAKAISLNGWTVTDASGSVYRFTSREVLGAGRSLSVRTGKGTAGKPADTRYWHSGKYIWNNAGDTATVRDPYGKAIDSCRWTSDKNYTNC